MWMSLTEKKIITIERAKWVIRDCREWAHNKFAKIARSQAQKGFINKEDYLKVNPCRKRKPMELFCHESRYMRESRNSVLRTDCKGTKRDFGIGWRRFATGWHNWIMFKFKEIVKTNQKSCC